jgi:hypothetical protein
MLVDVDVVFDFILIVILEQNCDFAFVGLQCFKTKDWTIVVFVFFAFVASPVRILIAYFQVFV